MRTRTLAVLLAGLLIFGTLLISARNESQAASRLVHKYRYTLIGLGPSIWLRVFIQISDPALETRLDFSGSP